MEKIEELIYQEVKEGIEKAEAGKYRHPVADYLISENGLTRFVSDESLTSDDIYRHVRQGLREKQYDLSAIDLILIHKTIIEHPGLRLFDENVNPDLADNLYRAILEDYCTKDVKDPDLVEKTYECALFFDKQTEAEKKVRLQVLLDNLPGIRTMNTANEKCGTELLRIWNFASDHKSYLMLQEKAVYNSARWSPGANERLLISCWFSHYIEHEKRELQI